ncbi:hypothetical protein [Pseudacidovorax intermedius]|uniref:hypothetical protein n=1 Tax=Pseudacidovorax intermedius TaxID=433924 RepID=UPI0011C0281A|nr:hypothetical protein [Pseudacidovorax intermedius]
MSEAFVTVWGGDFNGGRRAMGVAFRLALCTLLASHAGSRTGVGMSHASEQVPVPQPDLAARLDAIHAFLRLTSFFVSRVTLGNAIEGYARVHKLTPLQAACEVEERLSESSLAPAQLVGYAGQE